MPLSRRTLLILMNRSALAGCAVMVARFAGSFLAAPSASTRSRRHLGSTAEVAARAARGGWFIDQGAQSTQHAGEAGSFAVVDQVGQVEAVSLRCTHLGCTVKPSTDERELECPCHGSRFRFMDGGRLGEVLQGPASRDLDRGAVVQVDDELFLEM